jgi:hypothetical protein
MGFNQNPFVAKATAAAQKAEGARDASARTSAWLEAAHLWERAADREKNEKRAAEYRKNAESARDASEPPREAQAPPASARELN